MRSLFFRVLVLAGVVIVTGFPFQSAADPDLALKNKHWSVRAHAVKKLTDQPQLAKIAIEDEDRNVRLAAIEKLTIQAVLAKIALSDKDFTNRARAVGKLTDQALLAKFAVEDEYDDVREAATKNLTNRDLLAKIAVEDKLSSVRIAAVGNLADQALLAKIVVEDKDWGVREAAVQKLTGQALLVKIALGDKDGNVRGAAVKVLTNEILLAKIAAESEDPSVRAAAIAKLKDPDQSLLTRLAGNMDRTAGDSCEAVARLRLVLKDPIVSARLPSAELVMEYYRYYQAYHGGNYVAGEDITVTLRQGSKHLVSDHWSTDFPKSVIASTSFIPAYVDVSDMMGKLFGQRKFTREDLLKLAQSRILEVRVGATVNLSQK